jgi:hypothetical protein
MPDRDARCKFVTQFDGVTRCAEPAYDLGFCRFHRDAVDRGEIDLDGVLSDACSDQRRRRAINYHGMAGLPPLPDGA